METLRFLFAEGTVDSKNRTLSLDETFTIRPHRGTARSDRQRSVGFAREPTRWRAFRHEHCIGIASHGRYVVASCLMRTLSHGRPGVCLSYRVCARQGPDRRNVLELEPRVLQRVNARVRRKGSRPTHGCVHRNVYFLLLFALCRPRWCQRLMVSFAQVKSTNL